MRAFLVRLPSGARYWTVLDEDLAVVAVADSFLRQVRFGRDGAESTTRAYAGSVALFLRWCARTGREWPAGIEQLGLFMTWLAHAGPQVSGADAAAAAGIVLAGPGIPPVRGARRINAVLTAVRAMVVHAVAAGQASGHLVPLLYEVADDRDLPGAARGEEAGMSWRMRARHRVHEPERPVDRAADADIVAVLGALPLGAGPADRAADGAGRVAPGRGAGAAPQRCASAAGFPGSGLWGRAGASACGAPGGQPQRGGRQVPPAADRAAGLRHGAGVRHLRVRADAGATGSRQRFRAGQPVPRSRWGHRCGWTRSTTWSPPRPGGPGWNMRRHRIR